MKREASNPLHASLHLLPMYIDDSFINGMTLFGSFLILWTFLHSIFDL